MTDNSVFSLNPFLILDRDVKYLATIMLASIITMCIMYIIVFYLLVNITDSIIQQYMPKTLLSASLYVALIISIFLYSLSIMLGTYEYMRGLGYVDY